MKKILFAAFAASLLAAGCQKTEVYQPANSGEKMTFSTEMKKITKADPVDDTTGETGGSENQGNTPKNEGTLTLEGQGFYLWAYAAYSTENITNVDPKDRYYDGMNAMYLSHESGSWQPKPVKDYYWPGTGKDLRFFAVSSKALGKEGKPTVTITHGITEDKDQTPHKITTALPTMSIADYTVDPLLEGENTDDLMVADFLDQNQSENDRKVVLNFHHALSKVEFLFKATNPGAASNLQVLVQKLSLLHLNNKGTLSVNTEGFPTETPTYQAPVSLSWGTSQSGDVTFTKTSKETYQGSVEYVKEGGNEIFTENVATPIDPTATASTPVSFAKWLMLPQTISDKLVEIIYIINGRQFKATFPLDSSTSTTGATSLDAWDVNKYIKYTITLAPNMITFDAKVETDWVEQTPGIDHIN